MADTDKILRLNFVRMLIILAIAIGYASTMPLGPGHTEYLTHLGYEPSWIGIQLLFFFSGYLALASLERQRSSWRYLVSKIMRNGPLLLAFTLTAVLLIYPIFGIKTSGPIAEFKKLSRYVFDTVSCINPGRPLPGLLDDSKYMCLIQGALWTFRWGLIAHIGVAIAWRLGLLSKSILVGFLAAAGLVAYVGTFSYVVKADLDVSGFVLVGLRLGYPFLIGMAVWAYRDRLPSRQGVKAAWVSAFGLFAIFNYMVIGWTPLIEVSLTAFWAYSAFLLAHSKTQRLAWMERCPHLALGFYLANWPAAQILLLVNPNFTPLMLICMSVPLALCLTILTYISIFGPAESLVRRKLAGKVSI